MRLDDVLDALVSEVDGLRTAAGRTGEETELRARVLAVRGWLDRLEAELADRPHLEAPRSCPACGQSWWRYRGEDGCWECSMCGHLVPDPR